MAERKGNDLQYLFSFVYKLQLKFTFPRLLMVLPPHVTKYVIQKRKCESILESSVMQISQGQVITGETE